MNVTPRSCVTISRRVLVEDSGQQGIAKYARNGMKTQTAASSHENDVARAKENGRWFAHAFRFTTDEKDTGVAEREREQRLGQSVVFGMVGMSAESGVQMVVVDDGRFCLHCGTTYGRAVGRAFRERDRAYQC